MQSSIASDITIIGYQDWCHAEEHGVNHRDLHFAVELASLPEVRRVLYVSRPVSLAEQIFRRKRWKSKTGVLIDSGFGYRLYRIPGSKGLHVLSTWVPDLILPILLGRLWWNLAFRKKSILSRIAAARRKLRLSEDFLMLFTPFAISAIDTVPHTTLAFDVIDNFAKHLQLRERERRFCAEAYRRIDEKAGVIVCVSSECLDLFRNRAATLLVRNGVDKSWLTLAPPKPHDLTMFKGKVVGFGGTFTRKFNGKFLAEVADLLPEVDFVLMGKTLDPDFLSPFKGTRNVHYIGFREFEILPHYYYHFDAGIILYHREMEHDGDPLKLYEYLSLGTPVVSLSAKWALERFKGVLMLADTPGEFAAMLEKVLAGDRQEWRPICKRSILEEDFWENKAKIVHDAMYRKAAELHEMASALPGEKVG